MRDESPTNRGDSATLAVERFSSGDDPGRVTIVPVTGEPELNLVGRLRYAVTVEEMGLRARAEITFTI